MKNLGRKHREWNPREHPRNECGEFKRKVRHKEERKEKEHHKRHRKRENWVYG